MQSRYFHLRIELTFVVGVHTDGGSPNSGSVIGPLGNSFSDYTTAIKIKQSSTITPGYERTPVPPRLVGARNLEYITIPVPGGGSSATPVAPPVDPVRKEKHKESASLPGYESSGLFGSFGQSKEHKEASKVIAGLQGSTSGGNPSIEKAKEAARIARDLEMDFTGSRSQRRSKEVGPKADPEVDQHLKELLEIFTSKNGLPLPYGPEKAMEMEQKRLGRTAEMCTYAPGTLPPTAFKESALTGETQDQLIKKADERIENEQGPKTKFFLNFPPRLESAAAKAELKKAMQYVQEWQCWASGLAGVKAQQQISLGKLTSEATESGSAKRSAYENMVYDHIMRNSTW